MGGIRKKFLCELGNESMCEDIGRVLEESSSAGGSHPHGLPEPDVNLSIHPALIVQPQDASPFFNGLINLALFEQSVLKRSSIPLNQGTIGLLSRCL